MPRTTTFDELNTARADIATDLPADESNCCELGCDTCEPDDTDVVGEALLREAGEPDPEAMYDRLAVLTAEMSDEQRRDLAELLLSGDVDVELLALVLRDQATVESDGKPRADSTPSTCSQRCGHVARWREDHDGTLWCDCCLDPHVWARCIREEPCPAPCGDPAEVLGKAATEPLAPEAIETVERARYRDDTRLLQCCGVARLIGHRAGCAEAN